MSNTTLILFRNRFLIALYLALSAFPDQSRADGSIQNHLTLDISPLAMSSNVPIGSGVGLSYDRYHEALKSTYVLTFETFAPFRTDNTRIDAILSLGFFTEITRAFSIGGRVGFVTNDPGPSPGFGALALRLPALSPEDKRFLSFFFEEIDLGIVGNNHYASFRLGMLLL